MTFLRFFIILCSIWAVISVVAITEAAQQVPPIQTIPPGIPPSEVGTSSMQFVILVTTLAGVFTTMLGVIVTLYKEQRNRKWDLEDRKHAREEQMKRDRNIVTKIEEGNQISENALRRVDDVNQRVDDFNQRMAEVVHLFTNVGEAKPVLERVDETTQHIAAKVEQIAAKGVGNGGDENTTGKTTPRHS